MKKLSILFFLFFISQSIYAQKKLTIDKASSKIVYAMKHPMHDWDGTSKDINGVLVYDEATKTIKQVAATVKVSSFDSGNSNRDSHMIEVMEALKFPNITFSSSTVTKTGEQVSAKGNLNIHGISKPGTITGVLKEAKGKLVFTGEMSFLLTDFGITKPTLLGVASENEVKLKINASFNL